MCMWRRRYPDGARQATAESKAVKQLDIRERVDQEDLEVNGPPPLTVPVCVSPLQKKVWVVFTSLTQRSGCLFILFFTKVVWFPFVLPKSSELMSSFSLGGPAIFFSPFFSRSNITSQNLQRCRIFKPLPLHFPEFTGPPTQLLGQSWRRFPSF